MVSLSLPIGRQLLENVWFQNVSHNTGMIEIALASWFPNCFRNPFVAYENSDYCDEFASVEMNRQMSPPWEIVAQKLISLKAIGIKTGMSHKDYSTNCPFQNFTVYFIRTIIMILLWTAFPAMIPLSLW